MLWLAQKVKIDSITVSYYFKSKLLLNMPTHNYYWCPFKLNFFSFKKKYAYWVNIYDLYDIFELFDSPVVSCCFITEAHSERKHSKIKIFTKMSESSKSINFKSMGVGIGLTIITNLVFTTNVFIVGSFKMAASELCFVKVYSHIRFLKIHSDLGCESVATFNGQLQRKNFQFLAFLKHIATSLNWAERLLAWGFKSLGDGDPNKSH